MPEEVRMRTPRIHQIPCRSAIAMSRRLGKRHDDHACKHRRRRHTRQQVHGAIVLPVMRVFTAQSAPVPSSAIIAPPDKWPSEAATGAAGAVGSIGRNLTEMLLGKGQKVRALVRREDERAEALRQLGAEVMQGDLTDLTAMHRAIEGCARVYFGMSVSADYLTATVNTAAVARHHGVEAFVNMSQMTVTQMSITESTDSPQHKLHWLAEQALSWSGLPVVTMRPTPSAVLQYLISSSLSVTQTGVLQSERKVCGATVLHAPFFAL
jgi:hypothetical protein